MKQIIFFNIFFVFSLSAYSFEFGGKLKFYSCNTAIDAYACNTNCERGVAEKEFKVNAQNNTVLELTYQNGSLYRSESFKGCSVVDKKNWNCETENSLTRTLNVMNNGIYTYIVYKVHDHSKPFIMSCSK